MNTADEINWSWRKVSPAAIKRDPKFQTRVKGLSEPLVNKYAWAMRRGTVFPPILVGKLADGLYVLDGFHRLEAAEALGLTEISARIAPMPEERAVWIALESNATHGMSLTGKDKRHAFQRYCEIGQHLRPDGTIKSLRQMRAELHNLAHPTTLSKWLREAGIVPSDDPDNPVKEWSHDEEPQGPDLDEFDIQLHKLEAVFHSLGDEDRLAATRRISDLANRVVAIAKDSPAFLDI